MYDNLMAVRMMLCRITFFSFKSQLTKSSSVYPVLHKLKLNVAAQSNLPWKLIRPTNKFFHKYVIIANSTPLLNLHSKQHFCLSKLKPTFSFEIPHTWKVQSMQKNQNSCHTIHRKKRKMGLKQNSRKTIILLWPERWSVQMFSYHQF